MITYYELRDTEEGKPSVYAKSNATDGYDKADAYADKMTKEEDDDSLSCWEAREVSRYNLDAFLEDLKEKGIEIIDLDDEESEEVDFGFRLNSWTHPKTNQARIYVSSPLIIGAKAWLEVDDYGDVVIKSDAKSMNQIRALSNCYTLKDKLDDIHNLLQRQFFTGESQEDANNFDNWLEKTV